MTSQKTLNAVSAPSTPLALALLRLMHSMRRIRQWRARRSTFRNRKAGSELGGFDSRIPLSFSSLGVGNWAIEDGESQRGDETNKDHPATSSCVRQHNHPDRVEERDDGSLFGLYEDLVV